GCGQRRRRGRLHFQRSGIRWTRSTGTPPRRFSGWPCRDRLLQSPRSLRLSPSVLLGPVLAAIATHLVAQGNEAAAVTRAAPPACDPVPQVPEVCRVHIHEVARTGRVLLPEEEQPVADLVGELPLVRQLPKTDEVVDRLDSRPAAVVLGHVVELDHFSPPTGSRFFRITSA